MSEKPSRTQKKKEAVELQEYGEKLVKLRDDQINGIALPEEILQAVRFAKTLRHGALRRQLQYIGTLMRRYDVASVREVVDNTEQATRRRNRATREIEKWRDNLLAGSETVMKEIGSRCPDADLQYVAELVREAGAEKEAGRPPRSARILFRYLKNIRDEERGDQEKER
ncbi:MAG: DUF615 domain-containing protein [Nitrospiraceae bacterium]|nr:DUF615 domain-containing protein [Nitrospiraceae bacterium]